MSDVGEINRHDNTFGENNNNKNNLLPGTFLPHGHYPMMTHSACCRIWKGMNQKMTRSPCKEVFVTYKGFKSLIGKEFPSQIIYIIFPLCPLCIANRVNTELIQGKQDPSQEYLGFLEAQLCSKVAEAPVPGPLCLSLCKDTSGPPILALLLTFISLGCIRDWQPK